MISSYPQKFRLSLRHKGLQRIFINQGRHYAFSFDRKAGRIGGDPDGCVQGASLQQIGGERADKRVRRARSVHHIGGNGREIIRPPVQSLQNTLRRPSVTIDGTDAGIHKLCRLRFQIIGGRADGVDFRPVGNDNVHIAKKVYGQFAACHRFQDRLRAVLFRNPALLPTRFSMGDFPSARGRRRYFKYTLGFSDILGQKRIVGS